MTLVELLIAIAVVGVLLTLTAPSFRDFILMQRLKGVSAQLITDLQFARSEAVARGKLLRLHFMADDAVTCYTLYTIAGTAAETAGTNAQRCQCTLGASSACSVDTGMQEVRTVQVPRSQSVTITIPVGWPVAFAFDPVTGGLFSIPLDNPSAPMNQVRVFSEIDGARRLQTVVNRSGRPTVCAPAGSTMPEGPCP
ncbi:MAG: GspH/FimT family pseudopilin [Betaproteobacteria bacterium]|nr:GspH/FimT family pseudopilin [Betaproteobacteria bacterium]